MKIETSAGAFDVRFNHSTRGEGKRARRVIACQLQFPAGAVKQVDAEVVCHPRDVPDALVGRKQALKRALASVASANVRGEIWRAWLMRVGVLQAPGRIDWIYALRSGQLSDQQIRASLATDSDAVPEMREQVRREVNRLTRELELAHRTMRHAVEFTSDKTVWRYSIHG